MGASLEPPGSLPARSTELGLCPSFPEWPQRNGACLEDRAGQGQRPWVWGPCRWTVQLSLIWILRYLEEGNIQAAEAQKRRIEQLQRDRRKVMEENNIVHQARFFRCLGLALRPGSPLEPCLEQGRCGRQHLRTLACLLDVHPSLPPPSPARRQTDSSGKEWWVTNNTYWRLRAEPGYGNMDGAVLW